MASTTQVAAPGTKSLRRDRTNWLCVAVIVAAGTGILVGPGAPDIGESRKPLGTGFVALIKMLISPIIFCTIVLGVGSVRQAAKVGKVGALALGYFGSAGVDALRGLAGIMLGFYPTLRVAGVGDRSRRGRPRQPESRGIGALVLLRPIARERSIA